MLILRNGGSALDAVEMAVKILEDREITNAGYGSNLAMDGVVVTLLLSITMVVAELSALCSVGDTYNGSIIGVNKAL
jgi:isoaspartyl peptidase/L-asparaginase-like protein (Ntn-hydrolase superfamily)